MQIKEKSEAELNASTPMGIAGVFKDFWSKIIGKILKQKKSNIQVEGVYNALIERAIMEIIPLLPLREF